MTDKEKLETLMNITKNLLKEVYVETFVGHTGDVEKMLDELECTMEKIAPEKVKEAEKEAKKDIRNYREFAGYSKGEIDAELREFDKLAM